ncbi:hypothetical protein D3C71_1474150 [compost metagenome]
MPDHNPVFAIWRAQPQKAPLVVIVFNAAVIKTIAAIVIRNITAIFAVVEQHFPVGGVDGKGQRIVIQMPVFGFFGHIGHSHRCVELVEIHRHQPFGKQHLLSVEQLIELVGRLLPGDEACRQPGADGQHEEKQRQTQLQAKALSQFHASPRV